MINPNEEVYLNLLRDVLDHGKDRPDRTGTGTRGLFGRQCRYDLTHSFPLLTTKKMEIKSVVSELLWFIEGSGDERRLAEIRYSKPRSELTGKNTIWTANANAPYWKDKAKFEGDLGRVYGVNWRKWRTPIEQPDGSIIVKEIDQIAQLIDGLKNDPFGRRHIISAWNAGELTEMALPPCHIMAQFYVDEGQLSCMWTQRSCDSLLGIPYNIASYAILTHMVAQVCGYRPGELIHNMGDLHIYHDHLEPVEVQLTRKPFPGPSLYMDPTIREIGDFTMESFELMAYQAHPAIKAKMAV